MKKTPRFFIALWAAKLTAAFCRLTHRDAAHRPGSVAAKLCPDFLSRIDQPATVIAVTGTNGKTAVCRLLVEMLTADGRPPLHNLETGNLQGGILSCFLRECTLTGKFRQTLAVLEIDERSTVHIFKCIIPDYLLITNLFRGSFKRCVHSEFIARILENSIPPSTKLILNADDLISSRVAPANARVTFGIAPQPEDGDAAQTKVCDLFACPRCNTTLHYDFCRYNHIGRAHCPTCGFASETTDYEITRIDKEAGLMYARTPNGNNSYPLPSLSIVDQYNTLAALTAWQELGGDAAPILRSLPSLLRHPTDEIATVGDKTVALLLSKGQNPTACSRAFDTVRRGNGNKAVVLLIEHLPDAERSSENISWLYDTDFEFFADDRIRQIVAAGSRAADMRVRLLLAGVPDERIVCVHEEFNALRDVTLDGIDTVYVLYDRYTLPAAQGIKERLLERLRKEASKEVRS